VSSILSGKYAGEDQMVIAGLDPNYIMWAYDDKNNGITPEAYAKAVRVMEGYADTQDDGIPWLDTASYGLGGDR
jgi:hypothetical protein